jgi:hypothetical protein
MLKVTVLREAGFEEALLGLGLSFGVTSEEVEAPQPDSIIHERMKNVAMRTARKGGSHAKWLESVIVWLDIIAPRGWWQEFDTYRVGMTKQSESTMHTLKKKPLTQENFFGRIPTEWIMHLNEKIQDKDVGIEELKTLLPEGFLQRRVVCTNYKCIANMFNQRMNHKLWMWKFFINRLYDQLKYIDYLEAYCGLEA